MAALGTMIWKLSRPKAQPSRLYDRGESEKSGRCARVRRDLEWATQPLRCSGQTGCWFAASGVLPESERLLKAAIPPTLDDRLRAREKPEGRPVLKMRWQRLLFLHWRWDPHEIQDTLPAGLFVDTFEGRAWLAIVPFFMKKVHPTGLLGLPWISNFLELNVRTYVHDGAGVPGVWFYSLVCNQPLAVELARRLYHLNYVHARMKAGVDRSRTCYYKARRRGFEEASYRYGPFGVKTAAEPGSLEFFLVERYVLFSAGRRRPLYAGRIHHSPYQVGPARVGKWSFVPAMADGFKSPGRSADHVMVAEDLEVQAWPIKDHSAGR